MGQWEPNFSRLSWAIVNAQLAVLLLHGSEAVGLDIPATVKLILRDHFHERPPVLKDPIFCIKVSSQILIDMLQTSATAS